MISIDIKKDAFRADFFEKNILYITGAIDKNLYSWNKFAQDFFSIEPALGTVRLYRHGRVERQLYQLPSPHVEGAGHTFNQAVFEEILNDGGSMVVNRFEKASRYTAQLCQALSDVCGHAVVGNAYVTKGGTGTFGKHFDSHCVFAVQLIGKKHWKVFRPTIELPLPSHDFSEKPPLEQSEIVFDGVLSAGDILYVPRGWPHEVRPIPGQPSLHIAAGIHSPKVLDYLKWVVTNKMAAHVESRETMAMSQFDQEQISRACDLIALQTQQPQTFQEYLDALKHSISKKSYINFKTIFE